MIRSSQTHGTEHNYHGHVFLNIDFRSGTTLWHFFARCCLLFLDNINQFEGCNEITRSKLNLESLVKAGTAA